MRAATPRPKRRPTGGKPGEERSDEARRGQSEAGGNAELSGAESDRATPGRVSAENNSRGGTPADRTPTRVLCGAADGTCKQTRPSLAGLRSRSETAGLWPARGVGARRPFLAARGVNKRDAGVCGSRVIGWAGGKE